MSNGGSGGGGGGGGGQGGGGGAGQVLGAIGSSLGIVSAVVGLAGFGISLADAAKQRRKASQAKRDSKALMDAARSKMMEDAYENIKLPTESYDRAFKANTAQQQQAIESLQGADARTLAAGIGKVGAVGTAANEQQRLQMGKDLYALELKKAENKEKIKNELVGMDVGEAQDLMNISQDENQAATAATRGAISSLSSGLATASTALPLYGKQQDIRRAEKIIDDPSFDQSKLPKVKQTTVIDGRVVPLTARGKDYDTTLKQGDTGYIDEFVYEDRKREDIIQALIEGGYTKKRKPELGPNFYTDLFN